MLNFYPEIHDIIYACSATLVGGAITLKFTSHMLKTAKENSEKNSKYYALHPDESPAAKKAVREKARAEQIQRKTELAEAEEKMRRRIEHSIANDPKLQGYTQGFLTATDKKLSKHYKKLMKARRKELERQLNY